jgi:hypothetical protein
MMVGGRAFAAAGVFASAAHGESCEGEEEGVTEDFHGEKGRSVLTLSFLGTHRSLGLRPKRTGLLRERLRMRDVCTKMASFVKTRWRMSRRCLNTFTRRRMPQIRGNRTVCWVSTRRLGGGLVPVRGEEQEPIERCRGCSSIRVRGNSIGWLELPSHGRGGALPGG